MHPNTPIPISTRVIFFAASEGVQKFLLRKCFGAVVTGEAVLMNLSFECLVFGRVLQVGAIQALPTTARVRPFPLSEKSGSSRFQKT